MNPFAEPLFATLLVLVVTNTRVILAADSRKNVLHPDGRREQGTMDKIFQTGETYYTVSGFSSTEDGRFSLQAIIHKLLILYPGFEHALKRIARTVAHELKAYFTHLKETGPRLWTQLQKDSHSGGEIVLVRRVEGIPTAALLTYRVTEGTAVKVMLQSWRIDITSIKSEGECFWRTIGNTGFLYGHMPKEPEIAAHPVACIKKMMEEGAKAYPRQISGPVNILEITTAGERWVEKSPTTPARVMGP